MHQKVQRLYPEAKTALINWIEQHFHEIEGFVATFELKDGSTLTIHDVKTHIQAAGLASITENKMRQVIEEWQ